jgi:cytochrome P450
MTYYSHTCMYLADTVLSFLCLTSTTVRIRLESMDKHQAPQFRPGRGPTLLSTVSQSLSFHASLQSFLATAHPADENASHDSVHTFVRAKILNRDVAVILSYHHCRQILLATSSSSSSRHPSDPVVTTKDGGFTPPGTLTVGPAYRELMVDFFPPPNLLLLDSPTHQNARQHWEEHMSGVCANIQHLVRDCVVDQFSTWSDGSIIDIYKGMKELSWKLLCSIFLGLPSTSDKFKTMVSPQETVLRG